MGERGSGRCATCSRAVHMVLVKNSSEVSVKVLEQTFCAHCWRPLSVPCKWPEPREGQKPPYGNGSYFLISNCGHVFHGPCAVKVTRCPKCSSAVRNLLPLHVREAQDVSERYQPVASSAPPSPKPTSNPSDVSKWIRELKDQLEVISGELVQIRRQLARPVQQPKRWNK